MMASRGEFPLVKASQIPETEGRKSLLESAGIELWWLWIFEGVVPKKWVTLLFGRFAECGCLHIGEAYWEGVLSKQIVVWVAISKLGVATIYEQRGGEVLRVKSDWARDDRPGKLWYTNFIYKYPLIK